MSNNIYEVKGYRPLKGQVVEYYRASTEHQVSQAVKREPVEAGGFINFSVAMVELLPDSVFIGCPTCECRFENPALVKTLG